MEILFGLMIVGFCVCFSMNIYLSAKERESLTKMIKAKDLKEFEYSVEQPDKDSEKEDEEEYAPIEQMPNLYDEAKK